MTAAGGFAGFMARRRAEGRLVVQPRMGLSDPARMRAGLAAVRAARADTVGTVTLDSYTRVGDHASARRALRAGHELNGYPLVALGPDTAREMVAGLAGPDFPVQVRHGSALPGDIIAVLLAAGLDATEGGPVSYSLPYSRIPLRAAVDAWARCAETLAARPRADGPGHIESFGGCMLGQLCPPGLLVALCVLEGLFFRQHGVCSVSLSYAQQTSPEQDEEAVAALRRLAGELLGDVDWHIVLYTWMGVFPRTGDGALALLDASARLAVRSGAHRLIVKTPAEAHRLPTVQENVHALERAHATARTERRRQRSPRAADPPPDTGLYEEARALVDSVREMSADIGTALVRAFASGRLDVPYCLHPDNHNRTRAALDPEGRVVWSATGGLCVRADRPAAPSAPVTARHLLRLLSHNARRFDAGRAGTR